MDQIKIGQFIALCRRESGITQETLAEKLGVSNKSVSKWETGRCLPDASLYEPLCTVLNVTISELFAGQRVENEEHKRDARDHLMQMLKYKLYRLSDQSVSYRSFDNALTEVAELAVRLKEFPTKEQAILFLIEETGESAALCKQAYDFYIGLFQTDNTEDLRP